jgi:hypothetical protein
MFPRRIRDTLRHTLNVGYPSPSTSQYKTVGSLIGVRPPIQQAASKPLSVGSVMYILEQEDHR